MKQKIVLCGVALGMSGAIMANQPANGVVTATKVNSFLKSSASSSFLPVLKHSHVVVQAGGYWSAPGKTQRIDIQGLIGDEFTVDSHSDSNGLVGLAYLIDGPHVGHTQFSYGFNFFYLPKTRVAGTVVQEDIFTNLSYAYGVTHYPLYAATKATTTLPNPNLALTLDAGLGPNFMRTSGFAEHSLDGGITLPDNAFSGHANTLFSATAGVGLQVANVFGKMPLECGYRFFYLGQGRLAKNTDQIANHLNTGTTYANAVLCSLRV